MIPVKENAGQSLTKQTASTIALLAGIWCFLSPWIYRSYTAGNAWNNWIVGAAITILAASRLVSHNSTKTDWMSWINCLLGIWMFASPWIYLYAHEMGRFVNSLCIGVIVFVAAICSAMATPHTNTPMPTHT